MLPEEFKRPPVEEFSTGAQEISPPTDEVFQRSAAPGESPRKKRRRPIHLAAGAIAAVVTVSTFVGLGDGASGHFAKDELPTYQNPGDTCTITVYADCFDQETYANEILLEYTVQESTFTELTLPECPAWEGCSVIGYAIEYSYASADYNGKGYNPDSQTFAVDVGFSLTLDELQLVPVWETDQIRYVFLHPIWIADDGAPYWMEAPEVTLDSGGRRDVYRIDLPLQSDACFYVCAMVPKKKGYTFAGWYNEKGERVYFLRVHDLFEENREEMDHWGDNEYTIKVTLTAKWIKN